MAKPPPQLVMVRPNLTALPAVKLPSGYTLRTYRSGDRQAWNELMDAAFDWEKGHADFDKLMAADPCYRPERIQLIADQEQKLVATASAWIDPSFGPRAGMLHWVGTHPEHQGRGLGYQVSLAALHYTAAEGLGAMGLLTDDFRLPAVVTYLKMAFLPAPTDQTHPQRWRDILHRLDWADRFDSVLAGPLLPKDQAADLLAADQTT